jgi:hypothetical protein
MKPLDFELHKGILNAGRKGSDMKGLLISAALCITLFLAGYVLIAQEELSEDVKSITGIVMLITSIAFCIIIVKIITVKRLLIIIVLCITLILVGYALLPEKVKATLPEWINSLVSAAALVAFMAVYAVLSLFGAIFGLANEVIRAAENILRPDNTDQKPYDKWLNE